MKRRGFLQLLAGLFLAPFVPAVAKSAGAKYVEWKTIETSVVLNDNWAVHYHTDIEDDIVGIEFDPAIRPVYFSN